MYNVAESPCGGLYFIYMKCGNNIIISIALLILVYYLFKGVVKEGNESPEEADKELSKSGKMYLRGIDNELSRLAKLKNQKKELL